MIPIKTDIRPQGKTTEEKLNSLVEQLMRQNNELKETLSDMDRRIRNIEKGKKDGTS